MQSLSLSALQEQLHAEPMPSFTFDIVSQKNGSANDYRHFEGS